MFEIEAPRSTAGLVTSLSAQAEEVGEFLASLPVDEFLGAQGEFWSPAEHLRHLNKSVRPVVQALEAPKLALRVRFGKTRDGSRAYDDVVEMYRASLADGATAGPFSPSAREAEGTAEAWRAEILGYWQTISGKLISALESWDDKALDRYLLPHPLLGKMTVREILFFTLYHNAHHARRVLERRSTPAEEIS